MQILVTSSDLAKPKPAPEGLFKIMKELSLEANDLLFIGDSDADLLSGRDAGVDCIAALWDPHVAEEHLRKIGSKHFAKTPGNAFEIIRKLI
jgi:phosphoglycolate phosphatase-like HAD superfamily hydrolase